MTKQEAIGLIGKLKASYPTTIVANETIEVYRENIIKYKHVDGVNGVDYVIAHMDRWPAPANLHAAIKDAMCARLKAEAARKFDEERSIAESKVGKVGHTDEVREMMQYLRDRLGISGS